MPHVPSPSATSPLSDILKRLDRARSAHSTSQTSATPPSPPSGARAQLLYKLESLFQYIIAPKARLPSNFDAVLDALDLLADRRASEENMHRAERVLDSALMEVALASAPAPPTGSVPVMEQSSSSKSSKSSQSTTSSSTVSSSSSSSRRPSQRESMPVSSRPAATPVPFPTAHVSARQSASTPHVPQVQPAHRSRRPRATSMIYTSSSASASRSGRPRRHASVMAGKRRVHWADAQAPFTLESPASGAGANLALKSPPPRHQDDDWWVLVPSPTDQQHPQPSSSHHTENRSSRHGEHRGSEHRERRRSSSRPRPLQDVRNHDHHKSSRKEHSHSPEKRVSSAEKRRREFSPEKKSSRRKSEVHVVPATVAQPGTPPQAFHPARAMVWPARPDYSSLPSFGRFYKAFPVVPPNTGI